MTFYVLIMIFIFIIIYENYRLMNLKNDPNYIKNKAIKKANNIIINFFINQLKKNNNITLDECILLFENSPYDNLKDFSKTKMRTEEGYRNIYKKHYKKAKKKIKLNSWNIFPT